VFITHSSELLCMSFFRISWEYDPEITVISLEEYEQCRAPRRTNFEMILPRELRQSMLRKEWGVPQMQIAASIRANIKTKNQRRATVQNLDKATKMEEAMEAVGKKVLRGLLMKKSTTKEVQELEQKMQLIQSARAQDELETMMADECLNEGDDDVDEELDDEVLHDGDSDHDSSNRSVNFFKVKEESPVEETSSDDDIINETKQSSFLEL
jgi:hypothetical protein